ncbi:winged helix DNA-binding domain-containing protein [Kribbella sp. NBC_01505]|uniref:winged helix DNA-binding domain-containing protein n=1 Tax=Kribbella sp. NBC_01505 TaxID=2903580 RepID=UPI00386FFF70
MSKLSLQAQNRATLQRQWLLERNDATTLEAIEHLVGMQAQQPLAPYVGLWTRLTTFQPDDLVKLLEGRDAVRGSMMRATIHLMSSRDFLAFRPLIQPRLDREVFQNMTFGRHRLEGLDMPAVLQAGTDRLTEGPATAVQLREHLSPLWPDRDAAALAHAVRCLLPTIQTPPRGIWGKGGNPAMSLPHLWLAADLDPAPDPESLVLRYLAAYGPASVMDAQSWSGLTHLGEIFDRLDLRTYTDADTGRTLYDLPGVTLPDPDLTPPTRFLPEYDNLYLSHADRSRWSSTPKQLQSLYTQGTVLQNGEPTATWRIPKPTKRRATLEITPITKLPKKAQSLLEPEAQALLNFTNPGATHDLKFL